MPTAKFTERWTPGPWRAGQPDPIWYLDTATLVTGPDGREVADCSTRENGNFNPAPDMRRANATLISAAPTMYAALESVLNSDMAMREEDEGRESDTLNLVRAALAKARGETKP